MAWRVRAYHLGRCLAALVPLALVLCLAGCGGAPAWDRDDPCEVVRGFLTDAEYQDTQAMWHYLSEATRADLQARADAYNATPGHGGKRAAHAMIRTGHVLSSTRDYKKIVLAPSDPQDAQGPEVANVEIVVGDGVSVKFPLVREGGRWAVNLPIKSRPEG